FSQLAVGTDQRYNTGVVTAFSSNFTSDGLNVPDGVTMQGIGAGGLSLAAQNASGDIRMYTGGANERVRIDAAGNVGIGTTSPGAALDVKGAVDGVNMFVRNSSGDTENY